MPPLYVTDQGARVGLHSRQLVITKQDDTVAKIPLIKVDSVLVMGMIQVTTQAMRCLMEEGIPVIFLRQDGRYCGRLVGQERGAGDLRRWQYRRSDDSAFCLSLAKAFVRGKLRNQVALLRQGAERRPSPELAQAIDRVDAAVARADRTTILSTLLGVEGSGTAAYFDGMGRLLVEEWGFSRRARRPPPDPINVLLSLGYTLLAQAAESAARTVGLDPYVGFLHAYAQTRASLALDVMEEFRPLIVDRVVLSACNNNRVKPEHFQETGDRERPVLLIPEGRNAFFAELERRWNVSINHPRTRETTTLRRCLELQMRHLAGSLQAGGEYVPLTPG